MTHPYEPYAPRATGNHGTVERAGHRLKLYSVRYGDAPLELDAYREGVELALSSLPSADPEAGRPGLGFVIVHRGRGVDYVVLAWWDRENELPVRIVVRERLEAEEGEVEGAAWRPARESESFCVWDLEILAHERDAYVETILGGAPDAADDYLERVTGEEHSPPDVRSQAHPPGAPSPPRAPPRRPGKPPGAPGSSAGSS